MEAKPMEAKLYVGNLSYQTTEKNLRELFMQAGNVTSVALIKEPGTQRSKGFAFVEMGSQSELQKAISMFNGYTLDDRQLAVSPARPRERNPGGGSGGRYQHGNRPSRSGLDGDGTTDPPRPKRK
jgi:cold-inducible RNA-binding protein